MSIDEPDLPVLVPWPARALVLMFSISIIDEEQKAREEVLKEAYQSSGDGESNL